MTTTPLEESTSPAIGPRDVGGTGIVVSPVGIDGAVFGWAAGIDQTTRVLDAYWTAGGNLVSTADHYAGGRSEVMIGAWLRTVSDRGSVVIETRVGRHPDAAGLSRRRMLRAVENSLTRLGTDYIDFLSFDTEDADTPIEESLETGARLISEGKVRFLSASRFSAATIRRVAEIAAEAEGPAFRAILLEYNLMERAAYEHEYQSLSVELGRAAFARLPLANGYLTAQFRTRDDVPTTILYNGALRHIGRRGDRVLAALESVAKELGETPTAIAMAWVLLKPGIAAAIVRATDVDQVSAAMAATRVRLERHHVTQLDKASA
ncbi:MAG TPA: aldo/keto reductase [Galbitalea sp.]|jgi:aryl-alcohol dehydrogenase-like predicted oxidoreductase